MVDFLYKNNSFKFVICFINRIDNVVIFNHLKEEDIRLLINNKLKKLKAKYKRKNIEIKINNKVIKEIIALSHYEEFGARKLDKIKKEKIENIVIENVINDNKNISIKAIDEKMIV